MGDSLWTVDKEVRRTCIVSEAQAASHSCRAQEEKGERGRKLALSSRLTAPTAAKGATSMGDDACEGSWHLAGIAADFEDEDVEQLWVGGLAIAVYRAEGQFYATQISVPMSMLISPTASWSTASSSVLFTRAVSTSALEKRWPPGDRAARNLSDQDCRRTALCSSPRSRSRR